VGVSFVDTAPARQVELAAAPASVH